MAEFVFLAELFEVEELKAVDSKCEYFLDFYGFEQYFDFYWSELDWSEVDFYSVDQVLIAILEQELVRLEQVDVHMM